MLRRSFFGMMAAIAMPTVNRHGLVGPTGIEWPTGSVGHRGPVGPPGPAGWIDIKNSELIYGRNVRKSLDGGVAC
jgi:hypothetical protein